jgi:hypothetical protein
MNDAVGVHWSAISHPTSCGVARRPKGRAALSRAPAQSMGAVKGGRAARRMSFGGFISLHTEAW